jgi:hypothetical protein
MNFDIAIQPVPLSEAKAIPEELSCQLILTTKSARPTYPSTAPKPPPHKDSKAYAIFKEWTSRMPNAKPRISLNRAKTRAAQRFHQNRMTIFDIWQGFEGVAFIVFPRPPNSAHRMNRTRLDAAKLFRHADCLRVRADAGEPGRGHPEAAAARSAPTSSSQESLAGFA